MKKLGKVIIPVSVSASAALLSALTGFFSGVSPGTIILRGLAAALIAGLFVMVSDWLVKNYLPELKSISNDKPGGTADRESGGRVNIVMPDEMPGHGGTAASAASASSGGDGSIPRDTAAGSEGQNNEIAESSDILHNNKPEDSDTADGVEGEVDTLPNLDSLEISMGSSSEDLGEAGGGGQLDSVTPAASDSGGMSTGQEEDPETIAKAVKTVLARDQHK